MDGFTKLPKMQCFKEGGSIQPEMGKPKKVKEHKGVPAVAKKDAGTKSTPAFGLKGTTPDVEDVSTPTMKKGGRAKKEVGTVKKYKTGGSVGVYGAKKSSGDKDSIQKAKDIKPAKAAAPSKAAVNPNMKGSDVAKEKSKPAADKDMIKKVAPTGDKKADAASGAKNMDNKYKKGGKVKKFADGMSTGIPSAVQKSVILKDLENQRMADRAKNAMKYLGPAQQAEFVKQGGMNPSPMTSNIGAGNMGSAPGGSTIPGGQKRGGKVKKDCK